MAGSRRSRLRGIVHLAVLFVLPILRPVQDEFGGDLHEQAVDEAGDLSARDDLRTDKLVVQLENEIDYLSCVHALLDIARQGDLIDANLIFRQIRQLVLETKLGWPILDAEVDRNDDSTWGKSSECFDAALGFHVDTVVGIEGVLARVLRHEVLRTRPLSFRTLRMRRVRNCRTCASHFKTLRKIYKLQT